MDYISESKPLDWVITHADEIMRENLRNAGRPFDDDAIADLSLDEAYDALLGNMGDTEKNSADNK